MRFLICFLSFTAIATASPDIVTRASGLYQHTDYESALRILTQDPAPDSPNYLLRGKTYFMMGDFRKAVDAFEKISPATSESALWLGRTWGRRAESSTLMAAIYAPRARQFFEKALALDPKNREAKNDLFDYYLNAPGFMGGGSDKAEALAKSIEAERPAEYEFEEAQIAEKHNDAAAAEAHLRRAMEIAPKEPGRIVDVARFVAKQGRLEESDKLFTEARALAPEKPSVIFAQARTDMENHRNLDEARRLLQTYIQATLTPDDPPRQEAEKLLKRAGR
jgi:tetratricopeptide (TPR) repeat protein